MSAAHLLAKPTPAPVAAAYDAAYVAGYAKAWIDGCTGIPQSREGALRVVARTRDGQVIRCRHCAAWHVHRDQERQSQMVRVRYQRPQAVPCLGSVSV